MVQCVEDGVHPRLTDGALGSVADGEDRSLIFPGYASFPSPAAIFFSQSPTILVPTRQGETLAAGFLLHRLRILCAHVDDVDVVIAKHDAIQPMRALIRSPGRNSAASFTFAGGLLSGAAASCRQTVRSARN